MKTIINGKIIKLNKNALEQNLLKFLREELDLTSVKNGCGIGVCGSCTILINNIAKKACRLSLNDIVYMKVLTLEALSRQNKTLHPLQQSFIDRGAVQCGFCTPGMILTAHAFLLTNSNPTRAEIRLAISPNLCRCTGYQQIIDAIESAAQFYQDLQPV